MASVLCDDTGAHPSPNGVPAAKLFDLGAPPINWLVGRHFLSNFCDWSVLFPNLAPLRSSGAIRPRLFSYPARPIPPANYRLSRCRMAVREYYHDGTITMGCRDSVT